ncbi:pyridoxal phosphate-dependent aminotransferase [Desulfomicrobium escambiense]|uniref:pyridoxal phosphate-dependent aminotransferase n=1 Tax=Desulfomicrobium escambiense TaxID=29503 RepID=UPI0003FDBBE2|nr:pyridoxal phosphate-dependent aminotransferase [Desulfomicrobium escambiense]
MLCSQVEGYLSRSSWIRRMFEAGIELKKKYGSENVYDFSLGNPDLAPPAAVAEGLRELADDACKPFAFGYMPNAGYPQVRQRLAEVIAGEQGTAVTADQVVVTCGAAGGINALFRAVLEPGDEVLCPAPYFVEYGFYAENHRGVLKAVPSKPLTFELDVKALAAAITERTRCVLVNSPNNPTGRIYTLDELASLADVLRQASARTGRPILLISDEPYRFLAYDGADVPAIFPVYEHSVVVSSFSKNLALAGERVGYVAVNPAMPEAGKLVAGIILTNRILGFVNAPAVGQKLLAKALGHQVDASIYASRRDAMAEVLREAGYAFSVPQGAFYFFPRIPKGSDDAAFVNELMQEQILAVPGSGFGYPGYFRLAFCVDESTIRGAGPGFARAFAKAMA